MELYSPPLKKVRPEPSIFSGGSEKLSYDGTPLNLNVAPPLEKEPLPTLGSKSKACLKYFSTSGCPYGENCHFSHYVPGGLASLGPPPGSRATSNGMLGTAKGHLPNQGRPIPPFSHRDKGSVPFVFKTRLCKHYESPEGCSFGQDCHFAHGEQELRSNGFAETKSADHPGSNSSEPMPPGLGAGTSFGAISTAKVCISSSLAGIIVGRGGANAKAISRASGAKLFIRDHETDSSLKNVEMEGSIDQIKLASGMVRDLLANKDITPSKPGGIGTQSYKSKLCANFVKGSCTYGDRCHFAHGENELRHGTTS